jgi:hypothetical protein
MSVCNLVTRLAISKLIELVIERHNRYFAKKEKTIHMQYLEEKLTRLECKYRALAQLYEPSAARVFNCERGVRDAPKTK